MGFLLFVIALILIFILTPINYWFVDDREGYFKSTARNLDIFGNREFRAFWNKILIIEEGYKFGVEGETISSALGKNLKNNTLTKAGRLLVWILSKKHCLDAVIN